MKVLVAMLADSVEQTDRGKLIISGDFDTVAAPKLPAMHQSMAVFLRLAGDANDGGEYEVRLEILDPEGNSITPAPHVAKVKMSKTVAPDVLRGNYIATIRGALFGVYGVHWISVKVNGDEVARLPLLITPTLPEKKA